MVETAVWPFFINMFTALKGSQFDVYSLKKKNMKVLIRVSLLRTLIAV